MSQRKNATINVELKTKKNQEVWVSCGTCNCETSHRVLSQIGERYSTPNGAVDFQDTHMVIQCGGCKELSFCIESTCSESTDYNPDTGHEEYSKSYTLYPNRSAGRTLIKSAHLLPRHIHGIYVESHSALLNEMPVLATIGIRAIIESVCKHKGISGDNLYAKISGLASGGYICSDNSDFLQSLRSLGNDAAHEVKPPGPNELDAAFSIVEHLLQTVYLLPKHAERMKPPEIEDDDESA